MNVNKKLHADQILKRLLTQEASARRALAEQIGLLTERIRQGATNLGDGSRDPDEETLAKMWQADPPVLYFGATRTGAAFVGEARADP